MATTTRTASGPAPGPASESDRALVSYRRRVVLEGGGGHALAIAAVLFFVLPFVFVILTSLMSDQQTLTPNLWPDTWQWRNFIDVWHTAGFATWWRNTIVYATAGTALNLVSTI